MLCEFVAKLGSEGLSIKVYLSVIRHLEGKEDPFLSSMNRLHYMRLPITPCILRKMREGWDRRDCDHDIRVLSAASCLGYFGFLILRAAVPSDASHNPKVHLNLAGDKPEDGLLWVLN